MKTTKHLLTAIFALTVSFISAQGVNVSGTVSCMEGLPVDSLNGPFIWAYTTGGGMIQDSLTININPDGSFSALLPTNTTQGTIFFGFLDAAGDYQTASAIYDPSNMSLVIALDGCVETPTCEASFDAIIGPLGATSNTLSVQSTSTGIDLTYSWSFGDGNAASGESASNAYDQYNTYNVCLTISSTDGCTDEYCEVIYITDSTNVGDQNVNISGTISCMEGLFVNSLIGPYVSATVVGIADSLLIAVNPNGTFSGVYTTNIPQGEIIIQYMDAAGGYQNAVASFDSTNLNLVFTLDGCVEVPTCDASFYMFADSLNLNSGSIYVVSNATGNDLTYSWSFGDGSSSTDFSTTHYYSAMGTYTLCLTIASSDGCTDTYCQEFTMSEDSTFTSGPGGMMQGFNLIVNQVQSVNELTSVQMDLFPNPISTGSSLSIQMKESWKGQVSVVDMNGRMIESFRLNAPMGTSTFPVSVDGLTPGIYQLNLTGDDGKIITKKFARY
jgi:PKD repeat protein